MRPTVVDQSAPGPSTSASVPMRPGLAKRVAAVAFYLGLGPVLRLFRVGRDDSFVQHHSAQALATIFAFVAAVVIALLTWLGISYLLVFHRDLYHRIPALGLNLQLRDALLCTPALLAWAIAWLGGLGVALVGSRRTLPMIGRLARRRALLRVAFVGNVVMLTAAVLITVLAVHASSMTRDDDEPAAVYMLYDDMGVIPRWVMNLGFYRMSIAANERWGPGSVVVAPLDEYHLRLALRHGRILILACHGVEGDIISPRLLIVPPPLADTGKPAPRGLNLTNVDSDDHYGPWKFIEAEQNLRFVYVSACDGGDKAREWEQALAPAEVKTFGRLSAVAEHVVWLWSDGPRRVREVE
jgi:uncharacterized membrane protein